MALKLTSPSFSNGDPIPRQFTCDGADISPVLHWNDPPPGTHAFALIAEDPDAPAGTWTHWLIYDLPANTRSLPEGVPKQPQLGTGGLQGQNSFRHIGYGGPCPPPGPAHHYFFRLYALDAPTGLKSGASRAEVEHAHQGHTLATAEWMGRYGRR